MRDVIMTLPQVRGFEGKTDGFGCVFILRLHDARPRVVTASGGNEQKNSAESVRWGDVELLVCVGEQNELNAERCACRFDKK